MAASLGQEFCTLRDTYIEKQFGRLNDMQRQAVFTTDGPLRQLKAIYEMRTMTQAGYMPGVLACDVCARYDGCDFYLDPVAGRLLCADCAAKEHRAPNLDPGALYALRHICLAEDAKLFNFTLTDQSQRRLGRVCEQYVAAHLDYQPKSLEFLHGVLE